MVRCTGSFDDDAVDSIYRRWTFGTGCGGGGTARDPSRLAECRPLDSSLTVRASQLAALGREFGRRGALYRATGGVHACGIADPDSVLLFAEDVGRHNAFDKVAGMALRCGMELSRRFGLTLVGFLRGARLNVYTGYQRVTADG